MTTEREQTLARWHAFGRREEALRQAADRHDPSIGPIEMRGYVVGDGDGGRWYAWLSRASLAAVHVDLPVAAVKAAIGPTYAARIQGTLGKGIKRVLAIPTQPADTATVRAWFASLPRPAYWPATPASPYPTPRIVVRVHGVAVDPGQLAATATFLLCEQRKTIRVGAGIIDDVGIVVVRGDGWIVAASGVISSFTSFAPDARVAADLEWPARGGT